jgi:predicted ribosome quality control (RQC) complex YloA/Tae2 family protein
MKVITRYIDCLKQTIDYHVGQNASENEDLLRNSSEKDYWFHLDGHSSAHVVAKIPDTLTLDKKELQKVLKQGAVICKEVSKLKSQKNVNIIFASVEDVSLTETLGTVHVENPKHVTI